MEQNVQDVRNKSMENFQKESARLAGLRDTRAAEERAGRGMTGDLDTVAQNVAFDKQMEEAQRVARGFYVGGVPTKPMKPQRLKKGGIASPKAKPKKMKKGGLASSRKK